LASTDLSAGIIDARLANLEDDFVLLLGLQAIEAPLRGVEDSRGQAIMLQEHDVV